MFFINTKLEFFKLFMAVIRPHINKIAAELFKNILK